MNKEILKKYICYLIDNGLLEIHPCDQISVNQYNREHIWIDDRLDPSGESSLRIILSDVREFIRDQKINELLNEL